MTRAALFVLFTVACVACSTAPRGPVAVTASGACPEGTSDVSPGCGSEGMFEPGCYASCDGLALCEVGRSCTTVMIDPCGGPDDTCDACGAERRLCL